MQLLVEITYTFLFEAALNILSLNLSHQTQRRKGVKCNLVHCHRELVL